LVKAQIERHYLDRMSPGERAAWKVEAEEI
jgi:hypothetical protein